MSLRRIFLLGAAAVASVAALVAIAAIVRGDFGSTDGKIFATLAAIFVAGSTGMAGVALLARDLQRPLGFLGILLATGGFVLWTEQIWAQHDSSAYWKVLLIVLAFALATLIAATTRLMATQPFVVRRLFPATAFGAALSAGVATVMILRENGDGWQFFAVLLVLTMLGEVLTPIVDRYLAAQEGSRERPLATVDGLSVVAVRGHRRTIRINGVEHRLADDEGVVVRRA